MIDRKGSQLNESRISSTQFRDALQLTITSKYFYAMLIYLAYAAAMVINNNFGSNDSENKVYVIFAILHVVDAYLFLFSWEDKCYTDYETWPEYLNIIGSFLYLWSSTFYTTIQIISSDGSVSLSDSFYLCRQIELAASALEVLATALWIYVWYVGLIDRFGSDFSRHIPGRGLTIYDPDLHASWTLVTGALLYLVYNIDLSRHPRRYDTSQIYVLGDIFYLLNAIAYMIGTLRDLGWFWMIPSHCKPIDEFSGEESTPLSPQNSESEVFIKLTTYILE